MAATRGARYLLRNGLDYINYQEYDRALRYLREAETRQKELNDAERRALKQAIERAQRGLREAVGSEAPYALSRRSHRAGGFAPAKPDTAIAAASPAAAEALVLPPHQPELPAAKAMTRVSPFALLVLRCSLRASPPGC